jgi:hypothetical protein
VGGLLKSTKPAYNNSFVMVRLLASTRNENFYSMERIHAWFLVCPSSQSSLATGPSFVSPQDHDIMNWKKVPPGPVLQVIEYARGWGTKKLQG